MVGTLKRVTPLEASRWGKNIQPGLGMSQDVSYGDLGVGQQCDVVSTEADYILDEVNKSVACRMVQAQKRAFYKKVEKRVVHTTLSSLKK